MKYSIKILTLVLLVPFILKGQSNETARKDLFNLLEKRKEQFDSYTATLKKKSGFFGNRTKNDMRESHATLQQIISIDNDIISALNRVIDVRTFEKTSMNFDASAYQERINNLSKVNDVLLKENEKLQSENKSLSREAVKERVYFIILFLIIGWLLYRLYVVGQRSRVKG